MITTGGKMNDILLILDDIKAEHKKAHEAWWAGDRTVSFPYFWQDWLCRAQLRKACELHDKAMRESVFWDADCEDVFWAALKAAGEGK